MDSWTITNIVLNAITVFSLAVTIIATTGILLIIILFHRQTRSVPILLASHTCLAILLTAIILASMTVSSLCGFNGIDLDDHGNTTWCRWRGFLIHGFLCALYDAYGLQAVFRFFRVVFYKRKVLHSFGLYCVIVPIEMIFAVICISPLIIGNNVIYLPSEFFCQTPLTNVPAILYAAARLYAFPLIILSGAYWYLVRYTRRTSPLAQTITARRRAQNNARDLVVIKRLIVTLFLLVLLGLPSITFLIMFLFTGHLLSIAYRISWLSVSFSLVFLTFILVKFTIPLRNTVTRLINNVLVLQNRIAPQPMQTGTRTI